MAGQLKTARAAKPRIAAPPEVAWRRRKDQRRPEILAAARMLIEEEGAANVTMARIAREAGISEATVYKYFENKHDLVSQVLQDWAMPFIERLTAELAPLTEFRSRLVLIAIRYLRSLEETPRLHRVFFQEIRWGDYRNSPMRGLNLRFTAEVTRTIENGVRAGEADVLTDPAMIRDMLFGGLEHIAMRTIFAGKPIDIETESVAYVDRMLRGIIPRERPSDGAAELSRLSTLIDRLEGICRGGASPQEDQASC